MLSGLTCTRWTKKHQRHSGYGIEVFFAVVFASILTSAFYMIARDNLEDIIHSNLTVIAQSMADSVETFLDSKKEAVRQLSKSIVIEKFLLTDRKDTTYRQKMEAVMRRLKDTAGIIEHTSGVFVLDNNGIVVASSEPADIGKKQKQLSFL